MSDPKFIDEWAARLREAMRDSPVQDVEKNLRAGLSALFARLDLVTREEYDVQVSLLVRAQDKLAALEARLAAIEGALDAERVRAEQSRAG